MAVIIAPGFRERFDFVARFPRSAGHELLVGGFQMRRQGHHMALPFGIADRCQNAAQVVVLLRMRAEIVAKAGGSLVR